MPTEPLHNMTGIPPLSYVLLKLTHAYSLRLQGLPPGAKVKTVLMTDQCHYWPKYITPLTNLHWASSGLGPSMYWPLDPCTAGLWAHPHLHYDPQPLSSPETGQLKEALVSLPHDLTLFIFISPTSHSMVPIAAYHLCYAHTPCTYTHTSGMTGADQMQAIIQAVEATLTHALMIPHIHTILWLWPLNATCTLLTLKPHRDTHIMYNVHTHIMSPPEQAAELLPWYMQWSRDLVAEMHRRCLVWNEAYRTNPSLISYCPCDCTSEWH